MMVRPAQSRTREQAAYLDQLIQSNETIAVVFKLAQDFGRLLRKREGQVRLEQWKATVRASRIAELIAFVDGLADDAEAVANGCSLTWSNGMVEGFIKKVKWIKRSSYGQAGFPLLQRRVRLASLFQRGTLPRNKARRLKAQTACENMRICMLKHITIDTKPDGTPITIPTSINGIQATSGILG
jgi:hypothetical protein